MFRILIVEDDRSLQKMLSRTLSRHDFATVEADSADEALDLLEQEYVDLIITDVMMPGMNGFQLIRELRRSAIDVPIMVITAKGDYLDKQEGFNSGADDYMVKPVDTNELILRINALLRRAKSVSEHRLVFGNTVLEYNNFIVKDGKGEQILPQKEFQLLYKLLSYPGQIFTRQQLLDDIWGAGCDDSHTLDVHISRLREKYGDSKDFEIVTIRGLGYRIVKKQEN